MKIALIGYGKMGIEIDKLAQKQQHEIVVVIDNEEDWTSKGQLLSTADVAIEFSAPQNAVQNIKRCFEAKIPVVVGTTGWHKQLASVIELCLSGNHTMFYGSNYSIGMNILFELNGRLAGLMNRQPEFEVTIEEVHHAAKVDAPSGSAIVLADEIVKYMDRKEKWVNSKPTNESELEIRSYRLDTVPGWHSIFYDSPNEYIEIRHVAKSRKAFAAGALAAAGWIIGKKGVFEMKDMLQF